MSYEYNKYQLLLIIKNLLKNILWFFKIKGLLLRIEVDRR